MILWIVGIGAGLYVIGRILHSPSSRGPSHMSERQFYRDEYRNEWREVNDPLYIELKTQSRLL